MGNRVLTSDITGNKSLPVTKDTLDFLQNTYLEDAATVFRSQITDYQANTVYRVYGFSYEVVPPGGPGFPTLNYTDGVLFYNNEFFSISGGSLIVTDTAVFKINTAFATFDPTEFRPSGAGSFNVHQIKTIIIEDGSSGSGIFDVLNIRGIKKVISQNIGAWNMTTTANITLPIPDEVKNGIYLSHSVQINDDNSEIISPIDFPRDTDYIPSGRSQLIGFSSDLFIERKSDGIFNNLAYDNGIVNRGVITYIYEY